MWEDNGGDNQLWFWDRDAGDVLRNKKFSNKVPHSHCCVHIIQIRRLGYKKMNLKSETYMKAHPCRELLEKPPHDLTGFKVPMAVALGLMLKANGQLG